MRSYFKTKRFWRRFSVTALATGGALATVIQVMDIIFKDAHGLFQDRPLAVLIIVAVLASVNGYFGARPRPITMDYSTPNTRVSITEGDLLSKTDHIVIGACDTFDTETPNIIDKRSLLGQAIERLFNGDYKKLDGHLNRALAKKPVINRSTKKGKKDRYEIGTVATVDDGSRLIFFLAYCEMLDDNTAQGTVDGVWKSLSNLWQQTQATANQNKICMPVIGGGHARISSILPTQDAIRLQVLSFMFASRSRRVSSELEIVVHHSEYSKLDTLELQSFLSSLRPS